VSVNAYARAWLITRILRIKLAAYLHDSNKPCYARKELVG